MVQNVSKINGPFTHYIVDELLQNKLCVDMIGPYNNVGNYPNLKYY